jgi:DNA (cytosine-5)-methyltransferase 1
VVGKIDLNGHDICKRIYDIEGISATVPTGQSGNTIPKILNEFRIRKLTPTECFRLMGLTGIQIIKIQATNLSNSQQYKMAGNSIVVDCMRFLKKLEAIDILNENRPLQTNLF